MHKKIYCELNLNVNANSSAEARHGEFYFPLFTYVFVLAFICVHEAFVLASGLRRSSEPDSKSLSSISTTPIPIGAIFLLFCVGWGDNRKRRKSSMDRYLTDTEGFFHFCWICYWKELLDSFFEGKTTVLNRRPFLKRFSFGFKWTVVMVLSWSFWWVM